MALVLWIMLGVAWLTQIISLARPIPDESSPNAAADRAEPLAPRDAQHSTPHDARQTSMRLIAGRKTTMANAIATSGPGTRPVGRKHSWRRPAA